MAITKLRRVTPDAQPAPTQAQAPDQEAKAYDVATIQDGPLPPGIESVTGIEKMAAPQSHEPVPAGVIESAQAVSGDIATRPAVRGSLSHLPASSGIVGDWDSSDIRFPAVKIVQGSGQLSNQWSLGTVLFGEEELLPPPDLKMPRPEHVFRFVPVVLEKQFRENLPKSEAEAGAIPRVVTTMAEVEALGGTTQYIGDQRPSWSPSARILLLVERPENLPNSGSDHPGFVLDIGGKLYAPAVYYAAGTSWGSVAKPLFNAALTTLTLPERGESGEILKASTGVIRRLPYLPKNFWTWRTVRKPAGEYMVFAPEVRLTREETSEELRAFVESLRG